ncbi:MAG TPA: NADH-quinone oxidoreductase subunit E, partial [Acidimicrobiaceae bacterium]|nr:NADH-quinone oxidoreductase subunit E [Acidimicrobiaceae bacterium]
MADLYISEETADDFEMAAVDATLDGRHVVVRESERLIRAGTSARHGHRHLLLPALHALQNAKGWISPGGLNYVCETLQVPPAEAYGVATFYDLFRVEEPAQAGDVTHVCVDAACQIAGAADRIAELKAQGVNVHESPCLGQCERANDATGEVAVFVQGVGGPDSVAADDTPYELFHQMGDESLRLLKRIGVVDPTSL